MLNLDQKDKIINKLKQEKEDRVKMHLDEIENLKLAHQHEVYMLKKKLSKQH